MGMYTELHFNSELEDGIPEKVVETLKYMIGETEELPQSLPVCELFKTERWKIMLNCDSYFFDADTHSTLRFDKISNAYYLCIRTNLKNYDNEIEKFIDWIMPYLNKSEGEFLGFHRYEESEEPVLIHKIIDSGLKD